MLFRFRILQTLFAFKQQQQKLTHLGCHVELVRVSISFSWKRWFLSLRIYDRLSFWTYTEYEI